MWVRVAFTDISLQTITFASASALMSTVANWVMVCCIDEVGFVVDEPDHSNVRSFTSKSRDSTSTFCTV